MTNQILEKIADKNTHVVFCVAPATRVTIGDAYGIHGKNMAGELVSALRKLGADKIFDIAITADFTIMEEAHEFVTRLGECQECLKKQPQAETRRPHKNSMGSELLGRSCVCDTPATLPMFTSCCPAWVGLIKKAHPDLIPNLSTAKSPMRMIGTLIKTYYAEQNNINPENIFTVAVMPCLAKPMELTPGEIDLSITVPQLAQLLREQNIDLPTQSKSDFDNPLGTKSSDGMFFGASGGVMLSALRTAVMHYLKLDMPRITWRKHKSIMGMKTATINLPNTKLRVAIVAGLANAMKLLPLIKSGAEQYHFIEVMACPRGCVSGTGTPPADDTILTQRRKVLKSHRGTQVRLCHDNTKVLRIYDEYLGEPGGHKAHNLLHTTH